MKKVAVLIPVYKEDLDPLEHYSIAHSLKALSGRDIVFIGPLRLDMQALTERLVQRFTQRFGANTCSYSCVAFDDASFESVQGYSRLLLSPAFYQRFADYGHILILQSDAIVLRDELDAWCDTPFDYVGAPWPDGYELFVNMGPFAGANGKKVKVHVGNGGLSLRRVRKCIALLQEFADVVDVFNRTGSSEDLFFSVMGALSRDFVIPNEITASRFSMELRPRYYHAVNGGLLPMGGHAWWKFDPDFWRPYLADSPLAR